MTYRYIEIEIHRHSGHVWALESVCVDEKRDQDVASGSAINDDAAEFSETDASLCPYFPISVNLYAIVSGHQRVIAQRRLASPSARWNDDRPYTGRVLARDLAGSTELIWGYADIMIYRHNDITAYMRSSPRRIDYLSTSGEALRPSRPIASPPIRAAAPSDREGLWTSARSLGLSDRPDSHARSA